MEKKIEPRWLNYEEAMQYTGLGRTTITTLVMCGDVPAAKVGKRVVILRDGLDRYLESRSYTEITQQ